MAFLFNLTSELLIWLHC